VEELLRKSIIGMTCSLKGCENPTEILISIRQEEEDD
jgi:hypothetical protein